MPRRVALDGIDTLRAAFWRFESFELGFVADRLLGRKRLIAEPAGKIEEIRRLFREGRPALAADNLEDCRLVEAIFEFETHFLRFLMPTIRGAETGSKKRYAGTVRNAKGKLENPGRVVRHLVTVNGPEPVSARTSRIDYQHCLDRRLAPVADGILHFLGESFARLTARQLELFAPHRVTAQPGNLVRRSS